VPLRAFFYHNKAIEGDGLLLNCCLSLEVCLWLHTVCRQ